MLKKLVFHNYRCFENSEITFRNTVVVVGNNNAGKSTLVEALRIVGEASQKFKRAQYIQAPPDLKLPVVIKGFKLNIDNLKIDLRTVVYQYQAGVFAEIRADFSDEISIKVFLADGFAFAVLFNDGHNVSSSAQAKRLADLELFVMPQLGLIREDESRLTEETVRKDMYSRLSSRHFRNELLLFKESFDTFRMLAQDTWPGLRIDDLIYSFGEPLSLLVTDGDYASEIGMMGSGLQMWLQIVWFISRCPETAIVVLDEPDVYMHPDLQRKILKLVQQRFNQIVIATHSVEIISGVEPREIVTVDKKSRRMRYANSYRAVQDVISNLGSEHNLSLVRLGTAKKCVFVEGKDIKTLTKLQSILYPNNQFSLDELPTVTLGGWGRYKEALGAARLFYDETHDEIKTYCILDRDYHTETEINELYAMAEESHLLLHVWEKKELENYILVPKALAKVAGIPTEGPKYSDFCSALFEELEHLAIQTKDNMLDHLYKLDQSKLPSYYRPIVDSLFNPKWETLTGRLSIACGKDILSLVNDWIKRVFKKSSSRSRIIGALTAADIPNEMQSVIDELLH